MKSEGAQDTGLLSHLCVIGVASFLLILYPAHLPPAGREGTVAVAWLGACCQRCRYGESHCSSTSSHPGPAHSIPVCQSPLPLAHFLTDFFSWFFYELGWSCFHSVRVCGVTIVSDLLHYRKFCATESREVGW